MKQYLNFSDVVLSCLSIFKNVNVWMETLIKDRREKLCLAKAAMEESATLVTQAGSEAVKRFRRAGLLIARIENCRVAKTYPEGPQRLC